MAENFAARLAQAKLATKNDIANFVKKTYFDKKLKNINKKVTSNKTKNVLAKKELDELSEKVKLIAANELTKHLINKYSIFNGAKYSEDGLQNYLVYQSSIKCFKLLTNNYTVKEWESKGLSNNSIRAPTSPNNSVNPKLDCFNEPIE